MRVLDLFCGAGGASMGYHQAWPDAEIVGVDINPQPNYPFKFQQYDVNALRDDEFSRFDFIHASPPCHDHSKVTAKSRSVDGVKGTGWMLQEWADRLGQLDVPWVIENVETAKMPAAPTEFKLCGSSFGLDVRRHRKFICNFEVEPPPCQHAWQTPRFQSLLSTNRKAGKLATVVGVHGHTQYAGEFALRCKAMGIDWMTNTELCQSIPPAYTEFIGRQLLKEEQ